MRGFNEWLKNRVLSESMNLYVADFDYGSNVQSVEDIANALVSKVLWPVLQKMQGQKLPVAPYDMISPDGSFYEHGHQIINFYTGGLSPEDEQKILQGIQYYLKEMGVKYGAFKKEKSGMKASDVIRIPVASFEKTANAPMELNLSNANARVIFGDVLNFQGDESGYPNISPADLLMKIDNLPDFSIGLHQRDPYSQQSKGGPQMYYGGLSEDAIRQRLDIIRKIAQWAIQNHYDRLFVA